VSVTVERPKEMTSPKLGLIESGPLKVVLTVRGILGEEEWAWLTSTRRGRSRRRSTERLTPR
jgi:hypothetical protein